jgi:hypothetical protein
MRHPRERRSWKPPAGAALFRHLPANDLLQRHLTHFFHGLVQLVTLAALRIPLANFG